jgi:hypothetical protein
MPRLIFAESAAAFAGADRVIDSFEALDGCGESTHISADLLLR